MGDIPPDRVEAVKLGADYADDPEGLITVMHEYRSAGHGDMAQWMKDAYAAVIIAEWVVHDESDRIELVGMHRMNDDESEPDMSKGRHAKPTARGWDSQRDILLALAALVSVSITVAAFSQGAWAVGGAWAIISIVAGVRVVRRRRGGKS